MRFKLKGREVTEADMEEAGEEGSVKVDDEKGRFTLPIRVE